MGAWYGVSGGMTVQDKPETRELCAELQEAVSDPFNLEFEDNVNNGTIEISIHGGDSVSYSTASNIDDILEEFGPYVIGVAMFTTKCDDEKDELWVGSEEQIAQGQSELRVRVAKEAVEVLTNEERKKLLHFFS